VALLELEHLKPVVHQQAERSNGNLEPLWSGIKVAEFADLGPIAFSSVEKP